MTSGCKRCGIDHGYCITIGPEDEDEDDIPDTGRPTPGWLRDSIRRITKRLVDRNVLPRRFLTH